MAERMDTELLDEETTVRVLHALERVNALLGGVRATLYHLKRFARCWTPNDLIRIVDWGTGGADIPRAIIHWARRCQYRIEIVGIDQNAMLVDYARKACLHYPEIRIVQADFNQLPLNDFQGPFDYAISSLCLHHLTNEQIAGLLRKSDQMIRRGIIFNDLQRSARAWAWIWILTRLTGAHPIVQHDAPLSVRRAFACQELKDLVTQSGLSYPNVYTHFGYRLVLGGEKA